MRTPCIQLLVFFVGVPCLIACSSIVGTVEVPPTQVVESEEKHAAILVVEDYMSAVSENNRTRAEGLLVGRKIKILTKQEIRELEKRGGVSEAPNVIDWFRVFREEGFVLSEARLEDLTGQTAMVEAKCIVPERKAPEFPQLVTFQLEFINDVWRIAKIDLRFVNKRDRPKGENKFRVSKELPKVFGTSGLPRFPRFA
jgi:hypothetical protein